MYFVNWIDHAFEVLGKLAEAVYKTGYKEDKELFEQWKCNVRNLSSIINHGYIQIDRLWLLKNFWKFLNRNH